MQLKKAPGGGDSVPAAACSNMAMVAGNEKLFTKIIDGDEVKEWVGIGWIGIGEPDDADLQTLPMLLRDG